MIDALKHVHLIGAGGVGLSAVGKWLLLQGVRVTGSDQVSSLFTDELIDLGAGIYPSHDAAHVAETVDLILYSSAVPEANPERLVAVDRGIDEMSYAAFLGVLSKVKKTIAVTGTNGKSTTTAMLGKMLEAAGMDPMVIVGSRVPGWEHGNLRPGNGEWLVLEACEYKANHLLLHPEHVVLTNVAEDHLDYYDDLEHIERTFETFLSQVAGTVIVNADDPHSMALTTPEQTLTFSTDGAGDFEAIDRVVEVGAQSFALVHEEGMGELGRVSLKIPGLYNVQNALAAAAMATHVGASFSAIQRALKHFTGIWRRFEVAGTFKGATVISDYGHHPDALAKSLEAVREFYGSRRIVHVFEPHQHARTKDLFNDFVSVLGEADVTIVSEIYEVAGRTEEDHVSSQDLVLAVERSDREADIRYVPDLKEARLLLETLVQEGDVLFIQGAGTIDNLARELVQSV